MITLRAVTIACLLLSGGCTTYQPDGLTGGFRETRLDENVWEVFFGGNAFADEQKVRDFAMLRAAEITLEHGYQYFVVLDEADWNKVVTTRSSGTAHTNYSGTVSNGHVSGSATTTYDPSSTNTFEKPRSRRVIMAFEEKPEGFASYSATYIKDSISESYDIDLE